MKSYTEGVGILMDLRACSSVFAPGTHSLRTAVGWGLLSEIASGIGHEAGRGGEIGPIAKFTHFPA